MLALSVLACLLATAAWAASVCPVGKRSFRIHPFNHPDMCISTFPDNYFVEPYEGGNGRLEWVDAYVAPCNGSTSQIWEWYEDPAFGAAGAALRNPKKWPPELKPWNDVGLVLNPFQYRFPLTQGSSIYVQWFSPQPGYQQGWKYTTDLQLINSWTYNGQQTCLDLRNGDPAQGLQIWGCYANNPNQMWKFEYL